MSNANTIEEFGVFVGRERRGANKLLGRDDCPVSPNPPWSSRQVKTFQVWVSTLQEDRSSNSGNEISVSDILKANPKAAATIAYTEERTAKTKVEREILEGKYVKKGDVRDEFKKYCHIVKTHILSAPRGLTPRLSRGDEDRMEKALRLVLQTASQDLQREIQGDEEE